MSDVLDQWEAEAKEEAFCDIMGHDPNPKRIIALIDLIRKKDEVLNEVSLNIYSDSDPRSLLKTLHARAVGALALNKNLK